MRITAWMLTFGLLANLFVGCRTPGMGLTKAETPQPPVEERVEYGFPWSKNKKPGHSDNVAVKSGESSEDLSAELAAQLAEARSAGKKNKPSVNETLQRAAAAEASGDLDAARAAYLDVVTHEPRHAEAHHRLGVIADMSRDSRTADEHYAQAYAASPQDADLLSDMGYSLYLRGRFEEAESRLKEALEHNQYHRSAMTNLGLVCGKQGRYDEALKMFRQAGTESEAQKNIASLFPNGRPNSASDLASSSSPMTAPLPMTPAESDIRANATNGLSFEEVVQQFSSGTNSSLPSASNDTVRNVPPGANPNSASRTSPANPFAAASPAMVAKATDPAEVWHGGFENGANSVATANSQSQAHQLAGPWEQATTTAGGQHVPVTAVLPASSSTATFSSLSMGTGSRLSPTQLAAQMAIGTGPGSMFPVSTPARASYPASPASISFGANPANPSNPWAMPAATPPVSRQNSSEYPEIPFGSMPHSPQTSQEVNWAVERATETGLSEDRGPSSIATAPSSVQGANWEQLAPPSPWNDVPRQSVWGDQSRPTGSQPGTATGAGTAAGNTSANPWGEPVQRSTAGNAWPTSNFSADQPRGNLPVVTPGPTVNGPTRTASTSPAPWAGSSAMPGTSSSTPDSGASTTIPNWPYAPSRP